MECSFRSTYQLSCYDLPADLHSEFSRFHRERSIKRSQQRVSSHSARCGLQIRLMELHWHPRLTSDISPLDWAVHICLMPWRWLPLCQQRRASPLPSSSLLRRTQAPSLQISYPPTVVNPSISFGFVYLSRWSLSSRDSSSPIPYPTAGLLIPRLFLRLQ